MTYWFVLFLQYSVGSSNKFVQNCCCSVTKSCLTLCDSMDCSMPGFPVLHHPLEFAQTHVHSISDTIKISHPLSPTFPPALNLSQQQYVFKGVNSAKVLELQLQHPSNEYSKLISFRFDWCHFFPVYVPAGVSLKLNWRTRLMFHVL